MWRPSPTPRRCAGPRRSARPTSGGALQADDDTEEHTYERRADKAAHLAERLAQRATSEQRDE